MKSSSDFTEI